jgi:hypothetical protein
MHRSSSGPVLPAVAYAVINDGAGGGQHQSGVERFLLAIAAIEGADQRVVRSQRRVADYCTDRTIGRDRNAANQYGLDCHGWHYGDCIFFDVFIWFADVGPHHVLRSCGRVLHGGFRARSNSSNYATTAEALTDSMPASRTFLPLCDTARRRAEKF